jgi:hypothetical protein
VGGTEPVPEDAPAYARHPPAHATEGCSPTTRPMGRRKHLMSDQQRIHLNGTEPGARVMVGLLSANERAEWARADRQRRLELVTLAGIRARGVARGDAARTAKDIPHLGLTGLPRAGTDVPTRTMRRRQATARARAGRVDGRQADERTGQFDPASGLWAKVCPYCHRVFTTKRRDAVSCPKANCRKRHSRRSL